MKWFLKMLFCKHKWDKKDTVMIHGGMNKADILVCDKCNTEKIKPWGFK